jgi:hypothetical protein
MRTSPDFKANPIGMFVDPERIADAVAAGESFEAIHARATTGELSPAAALPAEGAE